jgi:hypothetical protein
MADERGDQTSAEWTREPGLAGLGLVPEAGSP